MEQLKTIINHQKEHLNDDVKPLLDDSALKNVSRYPFNLYTNIFSVLLKKGNLSYEYYTKIRDEYFIRNPHLDKFEMAPRTFGQTWGEEWLKANHAVLVDPPKKDGYTSEFDLWLPISEEKGIKIEVKSSHIADNKSDKPLVEKAFKKPKGTGSKESILNEIEKLHFEMNFQQLKPSCCDVFVWIAVWLDTIDYWVIPSSKIVMKPKCLSRRKPKDSIVQPDGTIFMVNQHQGAKGGNIPEGQIFVTNNHYKDLDCYKVSLDQIVCKIRKAYGSSN